MAFDGKRIWSWLDRIGDDNAKGEFYLTDAVALARADGQRCLVVEGDKTEFLGVNSRAELAACEEIAQERMRQAAMRAGVTLVDPGTVHFSYDTRLGRDVTVGPFTVFGPGVTIGDGVEIKGFCHFEGWRWPRTPVSALMPACGLAPTCMRASTSATSSRSRKR